MGQATRLVDRAKTFAFDAAGGPARFQVIALLAGVLALDTADKGTLAAVSVQVKDAFGIGNTAFGLLLAVVSFAGAIGTIPAGVLVDRMNRRNILIGAISVWAVMMVVCGTATSFWYMLLARVLLGVVTAAAWPCVASLAGDFFPARERASIYGLILGGEVLGLGIGFFISGEVSSFASWRWGFFAMAGLSAVLLGVLWKLLPEPQRGAQSWLERGETEPEAAAHPGSERGGDGGSGESSAQHIAKQSHVEPREDLVLHEDPASKGWIWALRYCLSIPSYRLLVFASAVAYYFFSGIRAFGMIYVLDHYGISHGVASALVVIVGVGGLAGAVAGGRLSEWLLGRGHLNARIVVPAVSLIASTPLLALGIWIDVAWLGVLVLALGAGVFALAVAPIDAARLDILHPRLWGRGEAGRIALRSAFEGSAPVLFGVMSGWFGGGADGLMWTFLIMLTPILAASLFALPGRKSYPRDVATAAASVEAIAKAESS